MVRGRLIAINGKPVSPDNYEKADAKRLVDREFNLSYTTELPGDNRVVEGDWFGTSEKPQVSIEQGLAKLINVKLGDTLRFDVAGLAGRRRPSRACASSTGIRSRSTSSC